MIFQQNLIDLNQENAVVLGQKSISIDLVWFYWSLTHNKTRFLLQRVQSHCLIEHVHFRTLFNYLSKRIAFHSRALKWFSSKEKFDSCSAAFRSEKPHKTSSGGFLMNQVFIHTVISYQMANSKPNTFFGWFRIENII